MPRGCMLLLLVALALLFASAPIQAADKLRPDEVPTFSVRTRVTSIGGAAPDGKTFTVRYGVPSEAVTAAGAAWSDWLPFEQPQVEATLKGYPAIYMAGYPIVVQLSVDGVVDPTVVEAELKFAGQDQIVSLRGELYGPSLGILIWREEDQTPRAATMAEYNRRYWQALEGVSLTEEQRPKKFPIVDRFIGGDNDRIAWRDGIEQLNRAGFNGIMLPPDKKIRELLLQTGQRRTAWAVYSPPGYMFDFEPQYTPESLRQWADEQAAPYREAGYTPQDMSLYALSDEPGWYYPAAFEAVRANPAALERFRQYLRDQGLQPADVGAASWEQVFPLGRSGAKELPQRRLFYWTMRFFPHESSKYLAAATAELERAFYPGLPLFTNWNFFSGRLYVPGPVANNNEKQNPDAAMGGHDWFEFAKLRGCNMLWTEDWFGDHQAYQWSFYCAKLRSTAERGNVEFGGYVIPRTAGDREDGIVQKILSITGGGGKALKYFVFGPEYNFPGNCYSERSQLLPKMAEAHGMIAAAEDLLWPGRRPATPIAILMPRSAQLWDAKDIAIPHQISDATNVNLNARTVDYMAEVFDLYLALQHANIPTDFVPEDELTAEGLARYQVLYVTEPNIPLEGQQALVEWVNGGGTLVTVTGAAQADRYDEPATLLRDKLGISEAPRERLLIPDPNALKEVGQGTGEHGDFTAIGARGQLTAGDATILATFADNSPAVVERSVGKGRAIHFAWLPGLSYWRSSTEQKDRLPVGFSETIRDWIVWPVTASGVSAPVTVSRPLVETPLLESEAGLAMTVLNWTGEDLDELKCAVRTDKPIVSVVSVKRGPVAFETKDGAVQFTLPLGAADIILLRP